MRKLMLLACILTFGLASCVEDKVYEGPAAISDIDYTPKTVTPDDEVTVTVKVTDLNGVKTVKLQYKVGNGSFTAVEMSGTKAAGTNVHSGVIPKQADKAEVTFYIEVVNNSNKTTTSSESKYTVGVIPVDYSVIVLNELNGNNKFIELFNKGTEKISLKGVYLDKDNNGVIWTAPDNLEIAAGEFLLLYSEDVAADHQDHPSDLFFSSGLSAKKEVRIELFSPTNITIDKFNLITYTTPAPASYSRFPNGTGPWVYASATPGSSNTTGGDPVTGLDN